MKIAILIGLFQIAFALSFSAYINYHEYILQYNAINHLC